MDKYLVVGNPIEHSKSPLIHRRFAEQTQQSLTYEKKLVAENGFDVALKELIEQGYRGLNVTVPFKTDAFAAVDELTPQAQAAGAVNTIVIRSDQTTLGENTDGIGLVNDICQNNAGDLAGCSILLLGAGGASRGVLGPLLACGPRLLVIANRTESKAQQLRDNFSAMLPQDASGKSKLIAPQLMACGFETCPDIAFDWIINGTAASLAGDVPAIPEGCVSVQTNCYDMMYSPSITPFNAWASALGAAQTIDGLGMLVEQAAEAFRLWRGVDVDTAAVLTELRAE